ncbi:hypothetical protein FFLO_03087 [Filobasidium floriforme]|uniref:Long chronological lifespan protein 2 n=1 Tax=Filobasidium floriforme TaxID=5210 RepID=A0A8K0JMV2_9TREE|nr:hypothetical protein FFLO_03087 [Filobasidium floriforme]
MSTAHRSSTLKLSIFLLALLLFTQTVAAQFEGMFNNMFGQQQQRGHHHHHGQEQGSGHGVRGWDLQDAASCWNGHVCSGTGNCVVSPKECPCPYPEDYKCFLPQPSRSILDKLHLSNSGSASKSSNTESFVCIRANAGRSVEKECERVRRLGGAI